MTGTNVQKQRGAQSMRRRTVSLLLVPGLLLIFVTAAAVEETPQSEQQRPIAALPTAPEPAAEAPQLEQAPGGASREAEEETAVDSLELDPETKVEAKVGVAPASSAVAEEQTSPRKPVDYPGTHRNTAGEIVVEELEFKDAVMQDSIRVISELTRINIVSTKEAGKRRVTLFVRNLTVREILDSMCRISGLWYRFNPESGVYLVMTAEEYQQDIVVYRNEMTRIFQMKYLNVGLVAKTIVNLFGSRVKLMGTVDKRDGDDYAVSVDSEISLAVEEEDGKTRSNERGRGSRTINNYYTGGGTSALRGAVGLSNSQIAMLEKDEEGLQRVSEQELEKVSQRGPVPIYISINRMHNMLFVRTADEKAMAAVARIVRQSDRQMPEVLLEMKVLEVTLDDQFKSAFDIANLSGTTQTGPADGQVTNPLDSGAITASSSILGLGNGPIESGSTLVFQTLSDNLRLRLQLMEQKNNVNILSTPMLLAANNHPAQIFIGERNVITTGFKTQKINSLTEGGASIYNYVLVPDTSVKQIGNRLDILPSINADRTVVMRIIQENSSLNRDGGKIPVVTGGTVHQANVDIINTSTLKGTVLAKDGMTIAVGGMVRTTSSDIETKVPVLGDIPGLGFFFRKKNKMEKKTELILLITPHILTTPLQAEAVSRNRVASLTNHPNMLDSYFAEMDSERAKIAAMKETVVDLRNGGGQVLRAPAAAEVRREEAIPEIPVVDAQKQNFLKMIETAAVQVRQPVLMRRPVGEITPVQLNFRGGIKLFPRDGVTLWPEAQWSDGSHHVTALRVVNKSDKMQPVNVVELKGDWKAATLESQALAPGGEEGDTTWLYLISEKPFQDNIGGGL